VFWRDVLVAVIAGGVGAAIRHYVGVWLDRRDRRREP
jgi:hypothetical protein